MIHAISQIRSMSVVTMLRQLTDQHWRFENK